MVGGNSHTEFGTHNLFLISFFYAGLQLGARSWAALACSWILFQRGQSIGRGAGVIVPDWHNVQAVQEDEQEEEDEIHTDGYPEGGYSDPEKYRRL